MALKKRSFHFKQTEFIYLSQRGCEFFAPVLHETKKPDATDCPVFRLKLFSPNLTIFSNQHVLINSQRQSQNFLYFTFTFQKAGPAF